MKIECIRFTSASSRTDFGGCRKTLSLGPLGESACQGPRRTRFPLVNQRFASRIDQDLWKGSIHTPLRGDLSAILLAGKRSAGQRATKCDFKTGQRINSRYPLACALGASGLYYADVTAILRDVSPGDRGAAGNRFTGWPVDDLVEMFGGQTLAGTNRSNIIGCQLLTGRDVSHGK